MDEFNMMIEIMKESNGILVLSDCIITMDQFGNFVKGVRDENGVVKSSLKTITDNHVIVKLCEQYGAEIEGYYNQLKGIKPVDEMKKAM